MLLLWSIVKPLWHTRCLHRARTRCYVAWSWHSVSSTPTPLRLYCDLLSYVEPSLSTRSTTGVVEWAGDGEAIETTLRRSVVLSPETMRVWWCESCVGSLWCVTHDGMAWMRSGLLLLSAQHVRTHHLHTEKWLFWLSSRGLWLMIFVMSVSLSFYLYLCYLFTYLCTMLIEGFRHDNRTLVACQMGLTSFYTKNRGICDSIYIHLLFTLYPTISGLTSLLDH